MPRSRALVRRAAVSAVALVLFAGAACSGGGGGGSTASTKDPEARPANEGIAGVLAIRVQSRNHTEAKVDYDRHPPAGGDHNPTPAPCGFYSQAIADEYVVHTMEHGGVWLAYSTGLSTDDLAVIRQEVAANPDTIATPYPSLKSGTAVVLSAWARQLTLTSVHDKRLDEFVKKYQNYKTAPEADLPCPQLPPGAG